MACYSGKVGFASQKDAKTEMKVMKAAGRNSSKSFKVKRAYQCPHCDEWHFTSQKNFKAGKLHKSY